MTKEEKMQEEILERLTSIEKRLFHDNGGECLQSKVNRVNTTVKYIVGCLVFVAGATVTLMVDFIKGLLIGI